jgi:hypothetical protein
MVWEVEYTDFFGKWYHDLSEDLQDKVTAVVELLEERGPALGRPACDTLEGGRNPNLKELRPLGTNVRILFVFDPRRTAILLVGGDKTGRWNEWYNEMIPVAERLYEEHLEELREEGELK